MPPDPEFSRLLEAEEAAQGARLQAHRREVEHYRGVAWSGLSPDPVAVAGAAVLARKAAVRLSALHIWRSSASGRLLAAMTDAERAVEAVRACLDRGLAADDRRCAAAIGELASAASAAMDVATSGALSGGPCATSTASSSPSTASSMSSAS